MERWKLYAFGAAVFAGLTSVVAKAGLKVLGADLGLAVRTVFVFSFIMLNTFLWTDTGKATAALSAAGWRPIGLLALSGLHHHAFLGVLLPRHARRHCVVCVAGG